MNNKIIVRFLNKADKTILWEANTIYQNGEVVIGSKEEIQLAGVRLSGERIVEIETKNGQKDELPLSISDKDYFPHILLLIKETANQVARILFQ